METTKQRTLRVIRGCPFCYSTAAVVTVKSNKVAVPTFVIVTKKDGLVTEERVDSDTLIVFKDHQDHYLLTSVTVALYSGQCLKVFGVNGQTVHSVSLIHC
jgi:hypothetical protein